MKVFVATKYGKAIKDLNRRKAIRERCLNCVGWVPSEVRNCEIKYCRLHLYRMGVGKQNPQERAEAIRKYCLWCCCDSFAEIRACPADDCPFYGFRLGKKDKAIAGKLSSLKAIRAKCLDCVAGSPHRVTNCEFTNCSLFEHRDGKTHRKVSEETKRKLLASLEKAREAQKACCASRFLE